MCWHWVYLRSIQWFIIIASSSCVSVVSIAMIRWNYFVMWVHLHFYEFYCVLLYILCCMYFGIFYYFILSVFLSVCKSCLWVYGPCCLLSQIKCKNVCMLQRMAFISDLGRCVCGYSSSSSRGYPTHRVHRLVQHVIHARHHRCSLCADLLIPRRPPNYSWPTTVGEAASDPLVGRCPSVGLNVSRNRPLGQMKRTTIQRRRHAVL